MTDETMVYKQEMVQISADIVKVGNDMETLLAQLSSDLTKTTMTWTGQSKQEYAAARLRWEQAAANLHQILLQAGQTVQNSYDVASQADNAAAKLFG